MSIGSATPKLRFTLQPGVKPGVQRMSQVPNPASVSPTSGPLNAYAPNPPINIELTRSPDGPSKPDDRLTFASVVKDVGGLSGYRQTLAVVAIVASATAFIGPAIGAGAVVVGAKVVAGAASLVSGVIGVSEQLHNYNTGKEVDRLNLAGSAFQAAAGGALVGENLPALAAAFAGGTAVNAAKAAHDPSLPNVAVAILGVGGLASQGGGEHEQLGGALHLLQEFFSLNATNPLENVAGVPAQLVGPLNSNATETAKDYAANAPLNLSSDPIAIKKGLISAEIIKIKTPEKNITQMKAKIKKLSIRKKILFAVGAVLGLACCAVLIAGTFGAAAIPLAILGGVAGTSIFSGLGVQLAQKKLGNQEKEESVKKAALDDLQKCLGNTEFNLELVTPTLVALKNIGTDDINPIITSVEELATLLQNSRVQN